MLEIRTANESPTKPIKLPNNINNNTKEPILIIAENPTLEVFTDWSFGSNTNEKLNGITDNNIICKPSIPSVKFSKNMGIKNGALNAKIKDIPIDSKITNTLVFVCVFPLDSSDNKNEYNAPSKTSKPNINWIFRW